MCERKGKENMLQKHENCSQTAWCKIQWGLKYRRHSDFEWSMVFGFRMVFSFRMATILFKTIRNQNKMVAILFKTIRKLNTIQNLNKMAAILFKTIRNLNIRNQTFKMFGFRMDSEFERSEFEPRLYT